MTFIPESRYTKEDLVACGNGNLFGPNNGRLPADEMLMFDSIDQIDKVSGKYSKGKIVAHLNIEASTSWRVIISAALGGIKGPNTHLGYQRHAWLAPL